MGNQPGSLPEFKRECVIWLIWYESCCKNIYNNSLRRDSRLVVSCNQLNIHLHSFYYRYSHVCKVSIFHHLLVDSGSTLHSPWHPRKKFILPMVSEPRHTNLALTDRVGAVRASLLTIDLARTILKYVWVINTQSYIELTVNAFRVLSQAFADAAGIVGRAVQNAVKGLRFALVRANNFELNVTKSLR